MTDIELLNLFVDRGGLITPRVLPIGGVLFCDQTDCDRCPVMKQCDDSSYLSPGGINEDTFSAFKIRHPEYFI